MGIYDREYYRQEGPSFLGSFADRGQVCKWLILINVICFVLQLATRVASDTGGKEANSGAVTAFLILNAEKVAQGEVWRLLTYAFLHDTHGFPWHILFNMLFLFWFGRELEDLYGSREFLTLYLTAAVLGGLAFFLSHLSGGRCLGASGAVTAVMVIFAFHYPRRTILLWFVIPVPIWLLVAFQVAHDTLIFASGQQTRTAVTVHLAGALLGFLYFKFQWRLLNLWPDFSGWRRRRVRPKLRIYREDSEETATPVAVGAPENKEMEHLEAKLDAVLEKMSRVGKENLTESELAILMQASEIYRRRRH